MSNSFDPYYNWLGIAPKDQPPNHYRLLGLDRFESNHDVIEHAADRQMAHLRSLQSGKHAAECQALLNEVSAARICLLDPFKKSQYDDRLRAAEFSRSNTTTSGPIAQGSRPTQAPTVPVPADDGPLPELAPVDPALGADARLAHLAAARRRRSWRRMFYRAVLLLIALPLVLIVGFNLAQQVLEWEPGSPTTNAPASSTGDESPHASPSSTPLPPGEPQPQPPVDETTASPNENAAAAPLTASPAEPADAPPTTADFELPQGALLVLTFEPQTFQELSDRQVVVDSLDSSDVSTTRNLHRTEDGHIGSAAEFNAVDSAVVTHVKQADALTLSLWVYPHDFAQYSYIASGGFGFSGYSFGLSGGDQAELLYGVTTEWRPLALAHGLTAEAWNHVALVFDRSGEHLHYYVNGRLQYETPLDPPLNFSRREVLLISGGYDNRGFNGRMDEIAVFDRPLDSAEIAAIYETGAAGLSLAP